MTSPDFRAGLLRAAEICDEIWKQDCGTAGAGSSAACALAIRAEAAAIKDEPQGSAVEGKSQRELNHLRNALDRLNDDCLRAEQKRDQLRERNARLVEALRLIGQKDHKGRPGWSAGAANKLANEALAANEEPK